MDLRAFVKTVADSDVVDWAPILRPTLRHRFISRNNAKGEEIGLAADQHSLHLTFLKDIRITMAYGMVENAHYQVPSPNRFASENARTLLLDCFWEGRLAFRETIINIGRNRCLLPLPTEWTETGMEIPVLRYGLARLIHDLAGPPTIFDEYFSMSGMQRVNRRWP